MRVAVAPHSSSADQATKTTCSRAVALAGFYGYGNFGDDLMAVIFGRHLQSCGTPCRVFRLCAPYAAAAGLPVAESVDHLLDGVDTVVWGGGGLLVSWNERRFRKAFSGVVEESEALIAAARARGLRLIAMSIGGSGEPISSLTPAYREAVVTHASHVTVRHPGDVSALAARGIVADYFPDVVWQTPVLFPQPVKRARERLRIGIDLYGANLAREGAQYFVVLLQALIWMRRDCTFVLLNSRNATVAGARRLDRVLRGRNVERYRFHHLEEDLATIASLDLVLSSRLHMSVVALAYGVPAISLYSEAKTRRLFADLSLTDVTCSHRQVPSLVRQLASPSRLADLLRRYPHPDVARLVCASRGHLDYLSAWTGGPRA